MKLTVYKNKPQFDPDTGKPGTPKLIVDKEIIVCDLTGNELDEKDYEQRPLYCLTFEYDHSSEPLWYEDHYDLEKEFGFNYSEISEFFDSPYHFSNTYIYGGMDVTCYICHIWILALTGKKLPKKAFPEFTPLYKEFKNCNSIEQVFRVVRLNTLKRLLRKNEYRYRPEVFGFDEYDESKFIEPSADKMIKDITEGEDL